MKRLFISLLAASLLTIATGVPVFAGHKGPHNPVAKVTLCHKGKTISVGAKATAKHIAKHGDTAGPCAPPPPPPACGDGIDNDGDGFIDEEIIDGIDSDGDGLVDEDTICAAPPASF